MSHDSSVFKMANRWKQQALMLVRQWCPSLSRKSDSGQGTTEYAILVGVLVVIAIIAIIAFRPKIQELWNAIVEGFNGL